MPRPLRLNLQGALYYVTCRAIEGGALFRDDQDYAAYARLLATYHATLGFKLFAFSLLADQIQLAVELTNQTTISDIMHAVNSRYTKYYNKRYGHAGHLFQERFRSTVMEKAPSLLRLTGYVHTSPSRCGATKTPRMYPWSSYVQYAGGTAPTPGSMPLLGAEAQEVLAFLDGRSYESFVASVSEEEWRRFQVELQQWVVGSDAFVADIKARASRAAMAPSRPGSPAMAADTGTSRPARFSLAAHTGVAVAVVSLAALAFLTKNLNEIRQVMRTLALSTSSRRWDGRRSR